MPGRFATGSPQLDALLEELRAGDNVVFYTHDVQDYLPFVSALLRYVNRSEMDLVYVRSAGSLDQLVADVPKARVLDLSALVGAADPLEALQVEMRHIGPRVYYLFEPLASLRPWFAGDEALRSFFLTVCPFLFRWDTVAYWDLCRGDHSMQTIAAVKDCTQVFLTVERIQQDLLVTPAKVLGRYSDAMFRPHRVTIRGGKLDVEPLPLGVEDQQAYARALAEKSRELAEIRDALDASNRELMQRNRDLAEVNERLSEQGRLYQSLRVNLDHLLALLRAGQVIGSSLAVDQVRRAIVVAAAHLFDAPCSRLCLMGTGDMGPVDIVEGMDSGWQAWLERPPIAEARANVGRTPRVQSLTVQGDEGELLGNVALAPIIVRGTFLGTLEVYARDSRLDTAESLNLLGYLASEASMALDNAYLYREVEIQGQQLRSFVEDVITNEEQDSRRLAFDLHDGLVQLIVASYQHLQSAQAWRNRDPGSEEKEVEKGVQLLRRAIYEARRLISELRPTGLDDLGLVHALRPYVAQLAADADWQVCLDVDPDWPSVPPALEAALFRIVQEATTNARKYAEAPRVQIQLTQTQDDLCLRIRDWGKGFDPNHVPAVPQQGLHMGLLGIRERTRLWGGQCVIKSQRGEGTSIEISIPRARAMAAGAKEAP
jgi:signal transduction histidine kinase